MKRSGFKGLIGAGVVATGLLTCSTAMAATDMFLKIDGVQGESQDAKHKGEIDVLAWSWGESTGMARTRRGTLPIACIQDLSLTKFIDSSTPGLIMDGMLGQVVPTAVLVVRKAGEGQQEYFRMTMRNVSVAAYNTGGSGEERLTENVVLHFESMQGQYQQQKPDGTLGAPIVWDISGESRRCQ